jgi:hypothetical protein
LTYDVKNAIVLIMTSDSLLLEQHGRLDDGGPIPLGALVMKLTLGPWAAAEGDVRKAEAGLRYARHVSKAADEALQTARENTTAEATVGDPRYRAVVQDAAVANLDLGQAMRDVEDAYAALGSEDAHSIKTPPTM